jgi:S1-C subfamily serine protease
MIKSRTHCIINIITIFFLINSFAFANVDENKVEQSVVLITNHQQHPDWQSPWKMMSTTTTSGSGFLIHNQWILTNAHVVSNSRLLIVNKFNMSQPFIADVFAVAHDSDLAVLKVRDPRFYENMEPLKFGNMPELRSNVRTYGYPAGGQKISRTEGVVSRFEFGNYVHPGVDAHLLVQTDSAINPGNSGGPVLQQNKVVGVAFQSNPSLNDVGYFIPVPLIQRFFNDIEDGQYDGVPEVGVQISDLLNPFHQKFLKMPEGTTGVLVDRVMPQSSAEGVIEEEDVLVSVDGHPIDWDGLVDYNGHRIVFFVWVEEKQVGEPLTFRIWRNQKFHDVVLHLKPPPYIHELRNSYDELPEYLIFGGLVFMPLNRNYIDTLGKNSPSLLYEHWYHEVENPKTRYEQVIILTRVLPAPVNSGYASLNNYVVSKVNDIDIQSMKHLQEVLDNLKGEEFYVFESQWTPLPVVIERKVAEEQGSQILKQYGILKGSHIMQ